VDGAGLTYAPLGSTMPSSVQWSPPSGFRVYEKTVQIGAGDAAWERACADVMQWAVKTRSGFQVRDADGVAERVVKGANVWLVASAGPFSVREPVRVIDVVRTDDRCGYAYGTLEGHPISGEEAFIVHRSDGKVFLTIRSLTRPGLGRWRFAFPVVRVFQHWYRRRYLAALLQA
jgi:uncharacterized protein (UPF0548 family)